MKRTATILIGAALAMSAGIVAAQTLYKLIDKNGKVTYSESAPKDFPGEVIRIDVDPNRNTATLPRYDATTKPSDASPSSAKGADAATAREKLESARKALADAQQNPRDEDVTWMGNKGGGTRAVPNEAYAAKLATLERAVKTAEEELRRAEGR
jgi:hypothetical protein